MTFVSTSQTILAALLAAAVLAGCSADGGEVPQQSDSLVVVSHESFALPDELKERFAAETGLAVTYIAPGDGGALVNQLILTKDAPLGDVVFGIDNTFSTRALGAGIIADDRLTAIDFGDVCINADLSWFEDHGLAVPATLDDLTDPAYRDLLVVTNPAASSPGLAFLVATVGAKGESGWLDYWDALKANGLQVVPGWSDAYYTEFSGAEGQGPRPLVLSYATSPAFTLSPDANSSTTVALLDTCFRQTEYAGVLAGASNPEGAAAFVDFLLEADVQASIPEQMYMYPADTTVPLPADWERFAPLAPQPIEVDESTIEANRDRWIKEWTARVVG